MEVCRPFHPVVVAPTYNNVGTLRDVLARVRKLGLPLIAVDDGSTDETPEILTALSREFGGVHVLTHERNRGKAAALRTAFAAAADLGYTHAATIDTDGQLDPEQIPALLTAAREDPASLVLGCRDDNANDYPARSRVGRRASNLFVYLETGLRVDDSQCGLRVYPLELVNGVTCRADRFGFETEIITRAGWAGWTVTEVSVRCRYFPPGQRVSHFRPWVDSLRGIGMHAGLVARALWPWPHRRHDAAPPRDAAAAGRRLSWSAFVQWLSPTRAWRQLRDGDLGQVELATGVAVGIFIANLPLYGVQTLLALYAARRLHLHPVPVVVGSQVSTPPVGPALAAVAIALGHVLLHGKLPTWGDFTLSNGGLLLTEWLIGAVIVGLMMAGVGFVLMTFLFRFVQPAPADAQA